jgi:hypothetical protein
MMKQFGLLLVASVAAVLSLGAAAAEGGPAATACKTSNTTYQGLRARAYCGPATATVTIGSRTVRYRGGSCIRNAGAVELGIGTVILDTKDPKGSLPRSFGVSVGRIFGIGKAAPKDGTYDSVMLAFVDRGKRYASMQAKATLAGGRTRGSFTGRLMTGQQVSGTFRCA